MKAPERVLLTGASGLIGRAVVDELDGSHEVHALGRRPPPGRCHWIPADLAVPLDETVLPGRVDTVIHLAQSRHFREFPERAGDIYAVNVAVVAQLLDWARRCGARRFVLASTGGVYGHGEKPFRESDPLPSFGGGYYVASKRCAELLAEPYAGTLDVITLRFFFAYGPGQAGGMLVPRLVDSVRNGRAVRLQSEDGLRINPIYVGDAAAAVAAAVKLTGSHVINVAGPETLTLREIALIIGKQVGREPVFAHDADVQPRHLVGDTGRMSALLGAPRVRFRDGIAAMVDATEKKTRS